MRAWLFQDTRQKEKLGEVKCPWSVCWRVDGKRQSKRIGSKSQAEKFRRKIEGELAAGTYQTESRKTWTEFRKEYDGIVLSQTSVRNRESTLIALRHFERICKPGKVAAINTATIDRYKAKRATERGQKRNSKVAPATINKELRHLRAVLGKAHDYKYLPEVPRINMLREPEKLITYPPSFWPNRLGHWTF